VIQVIGERLYNKIFSMDCHRSVMLQDLEKEVKDEKLLSELLILTLRNRVNALKEVVGALGAEEELPLTVWDSTVRTY
jgi:hypothetical protein